MVASIGAIASAAQGVSYYERDGYYANDDPAHKEASRWAGQGATELGLAGPGTGLDSLAKNISPPVDHAPGMNPRSITSTRSPARIIPVP